MILETKRLILRPWEETDAEELYRYAKEPCIGPAAGWRAHTSAEESRQIIRDVLAAPDIFAIVLKETGLPVGSVGLHHKDLAQKDDEAELGYWLGRPYWGQGLVPEAAREVLRYAFEDLKLERVWCAYYDGNEKSKRVQEKLGFSYQWTTESVPVPQLGETRTGHVNLLTKEEWNKNAVMLIPLTREDREQFILDNQKAFNYGALEEFGRRDDHFEEDGEIISRETIERSIDGGEAYRIVQNGEKVGGVVLKVDGAKGDLDLLFVAPEAHSKGIGYAAWRAVERLHPEVKLWETVTPYFEKRNIHFYVNRCGFHIVEFFNPYHPDPNDPDAESSADEQRDGMFRFEKRL